MKSVNQPTNPKEAMAYRYYVMGLNTREIGKLLDLSPRTIERYMQAGKWKESVNGKTVEVKAYELRQGGKTYVEIAKVLQVSKSTVHYYLKRYEAKEAALRANVE